jgi:hypothetical protein
MRWEVKEKENGKFGIYLCEEFWRFPDKPVCYGESVDRRGADQRVEWMNAEQVSEEQSGKSGDAE